MRVYHPAQAYQGIPPENMFFVADESNQTIGQGYLIQTYQPYLFPERPVNLFLQMTGLESGRDVLLGALIARSYQLREQTMYLKSRLYTEVPAQDERKLLFFLDAGFKKDDQEDIVTLGAPMARPTAPMGFEMGEVPLDTPLEQSAFLARMNTYRISVLTAETLARYQAMPNFLALYLSRGPEIVGEILFSGTGANASLLGLYIMPSQRRRGLSKSLIAAGLKNLSERGVNHVDAAVMRRNVAQYQLARSCRSTFIRTSFYYPGINID